MIENFVIKNFKSYTNATLFIAPLSILIGANASGKSNILEALRLLSWLAQGRKLSDLQYQINDQNKIVRGFINHLPKFGSSNFTLECTIRNKNEVFEYDLTIGLRSVKGNYELHIEDEKCIRGEWLYRTKYASSESLNKMTVEYNNFSRGGRKPQIDTTDQQVVFTQLSLASFHPNHKREAKNIISVSEILERILSKIVFLDPNTKLMRDYSFKSDIKLQESGKNISAVLYHLIEMDEKNKNEILRFIESLPEQQISDISFDETSRGEVLIRLHEAFQLENNSKGVDAGLLSDGTLRALAIVASLLSAEIGSLVVIEEIDNGIHPSRVKDLMSRINALAKERELSVLITSHNTALLNSLPEEAIANTQVCFRDQDNGSSKIVRIKDISNYPELVAQDDLGNLLVRGLIDKYVKDKTSDTDKISKGLNWLKQFADE